MDYFIPAEHCGKTVRSVARGVLGVSSGALSRLKFSGGIFLNGAGVHTSAVVHAGDLLRLCFPEKRLPLPAPAAVPPRVVFEDEWLMCVDKPAPLPSISSRHQGGETLENRVFSHLGRPESFVYRPVNRLDKGTSGLMMVAKCAHSQHLMQKKLHTDDFIREYLAVAVGTLPRREGKIDLPIGMENAVRRRISQDGRPALTLYQVEKAQNGLSLVRLRLLTGRTHQIRVHLSALGCPLLGDFLYGKEDARLPGRFALHACFLSFIHPVSGEKIVLSSPLPDEIARLTEEK